MGLEEIRGERQNHEEAVSQGEIGVRDAVRRVNSSNGRRICVCVRREREREREGGRDRAREK